MSWSNDTVLEFLELYRREQVIWNPKHPHYKNRSEINEAWERIQSSFSMQCSINDLKKKKESLMTSFRMHINKKRKNPEGHNISWFAYPMMESFLGGKYECDSTDHTSDTEVQGNTSPFTHQPTNIQPDPKIHRPKVKPLEKKRPSASQRRDHDYIYTKKEMEDEVPFMIQAVDDNNEMDEYDLYGQLLAKKLRKLDERQRDVAMHEIDNIMFRVKMQGGPSQSRNFTSSPMSAPRRVKSPVFIVTQPSQVNQYEDENVPYEAHNMQSDTSM